MHPRFLSILLLLITACSPIVYKPLAVSVEKIEMIKPGMTVEQVQTLLGKPYKISHLYEGPRDERVFIHLYPVKYNLKPYDKQNPQLGPLSDEQVIDKFFYRNSRLFGENTLDQVYFLQFVFEDNILIKYEPLKEGD